MPTTRTIRPPRSALAPPWGGGPGRQAPHRKPGQEALCIIEVQQGSDLGEDEDSKGIDRSTGRTIVRVDPEFYRPAEVDLLQGDPGKANGTLGWKAAMPFDALVAAMVQADLDRVGAR